MNSIDYFFSTKGKVERLAFLGLLVICIVFNFIAVLFTALFSKLVGNTDLLFFPISAVFIYITYCIYMKRFNDIGKMHQLVQVHFALMAFFLILVLFQILNGFTISIFILNGILGLIVFTIALFVKSGAPITVKYDGKNIIFTSNMLTRVNSNFVPDFETTGMIIEIRENELMGDLINLIMTKQEYERRQHILQYVDNLYVFHLKDLQ